MQVERLEKVVRGGISPRISQAQIKCISYHSKLPSRKLLYWGRALRTYWKNGS